MDSAFSKAPLPEPPEHPLQYSPVHRLVVEAGRSRYAEGVVAAFNHLQHPGCCHPLQHGFEEGEVTQTIPGASEEEHGHGDAVEMSISKSLKLSRGMERIAEKDESIHREQALGHHVGGPPTAEGFPRSYQNPGPTTWVLMQEPVGALPGAEECMQGVGTLQSPLTIEEVEAEGDMAGLGEAVGDRCDQRVIHIVPRPVRKDDSRSLAGSTAFRDGEHPGNRLSPS